MLAINTYNRKLSSWGTDVTFNTNSELRWMAFFECTSSYDDKMYRPRKRKCKELALSLASVGSSPGTCGMPAFHCTPTASWPAPRRAARGQGRRPRWQPGGRSRKSWPTAHEGTW